jgi:hypothetical protein
MARPIPLSPPIGPAAGPARDHETVSRFRPGSVVPSLPWGNSSKPLTVRFAGNRWSWRCHPEGRARGFYGVWNAILWEMRRSGVGYKAACVRRRIGTVLSDRLGDPISNWRPNIENLLVIDAFFRLSFFAIMATHFRSAFEARRRALSDSAVWPTSKSTTRRRGVYSLLALARTRGAVNRSQPGPPRLTIPTIYHRPTVRSLSQNGATLEVPSGREFQTSSP